MDTDSDLLSRLRSSSLNAEDENEGAKTIDDILGATIEEAEETEAKGEPLQRDYNDQTFESLSPDLISKACERLKLPMKCFQCRKEGSAASLCICPKCGSKPYHKDCWGQVLNHQPMDDFEVCGPPSDFLEYVWIQYLLYSKVSPEEQALLHRSDIWSTWFGVPSQQNASNLYVYPRINVLIEQAQALQDDKTSLEQYPSLVSFFGDTGGGKSTLIRALIRNAALSDTDQVPIPGNLVDRHKSTSGDVHLYCDPKTVHTEVPLFYADCEGLRGAGTSAATQAAEGEWGDLGVSEKSRPKLPSERNTMRNPPKLSKAAFQEELEEHRNTASYQKRLQWARTTIVPSGIAEKVVISAESRRTIVKDLYPRILYTFSDVVCYVTNNPRATEAELIHLFEWASNGHERTINQRVRPGLIIVVNKDVPSSDESWLDVDYATKTLLNHLELSTAFAQLRERWRLRGRNLKTASDLILCYYDSFRIICIPSLTAETTHAISVQYRKLYIEIKTASKSLRMRKSKHNMDLNLQSFSKYLEHAFSRLARDLTSSIDFHYMASRDTKRPVKFRDHTAALLVKLKEDKEKRDTENIDQATLVNSFAPFLACAIASHIPRQGSNEVQQHMIQEYLRDVRQALERFRDTSWRCEATNNSKRCRNYYVGHEKGHQFRFTDSGPTLLIGEFQCSFDPEMVIIELYSQINTLLNADDDIEMAISLVAKASSVASVSSNRTCFTCLSQCPVYILPCENVHAHTICEKCALRFTDSEGRSQSTLSLHSCPLGCQFRQGKPWYSRVKAPTAGVRLLSLDGGGIRGIVELVILHKIVSEVGFGIPIQELFDLVLGTSTGGILALGLFKMNWPVEEAIKQFQSFSDQAFSKRQWLKVPMFRHTAQLLYSYRFKSEGIEGALQKAFGQGKLFGFNEVTSSEKVKVGVVAGVAGGRKPYLFTNYSRNSIGHGSDHLVREENSADELKVWEAGRCTSAAPTYFAPYHHGRTQMSYIDGALQRNNPVQLLEEERQAIWGNTTSDIMLSIGTGIQVTHVGSTKSETRGERIARRLVPKGLRGKVAVGLDMVQSTLDCDRQWNDFISSKAWNKDLDKVCHRLNIGLDERPPHLDDIASMNNLRWQAEQYLKPHNTHYLDRRYKSAHSHIRAVVKRLVATLFYFEPGSVPKEGGKGTGTLHCRLSAGMRNQFTQLVHAGPKFRVSYRLSNNRIFSEQLKVNFDLRTFSSKVEFTNKSDRWTVEMDMPQWSAWESISGFTSLS